jgi:hypothetical protein
MESLNRYHHATSARSKGFDIGLRPKGDDASRVDLRVGAEGGKRGGQLFLPNVNSSSNLEKGGIGRKKNRQIIVVLNMSF